jgi:hypothetical protein
MHYNKQILESDNKVEAVWKIVTKETGNISTDVAPSININDKVIEKSDLIAHSFNIHFLAITNNKKMNNDTTTLMTEDATKYLTQAVPKTLCPQQQMKLKV